MSDSGAPIYFFPVSGDSRSLPGTKTGWICPKCGRVYAPGWYQCDSCNNKRARLEAYWLTWAG